MSKDAQTVAEETDEVSEVKASEVSVLDLIVNKGLLRLPEKTVEVYTDAAAAMEAAKLMEEQSMYSGEEKTIRSSTLDGDTTTVKNYPPEWHAIEKQLDELFGRLEETKMIFNLRGIAPALRDSIVDAADQATKKEFEGKPTAPQNEKNEFQNIYFNIELVRRQLVSIEVPSAGGVQTSFTFDEVKSILESIYIGDASRVYEASRDISVVAASSEVRDDAGFHRRSLNTSAK